MNIWIQFVKKHNPQHIVLNSIANACDDLGHKITRGRRDPESDHDLYIWWNGLYSWCLDFEDKHPHHKFLYAELAWFPQEPCFQLNEGGVNAFANGQRNPSQI